jgi:dsDNA-specific endonuclease/ATPase MutS2
MPDDQPVEIPIDGTLDLHTFRPAEVQPLLEDYLEECLKRGIYEVRIIHGKGQGVLRRIVHAALARHPRVVRFGHEEGSGGGWGATVVLLSPAPPAIKSSIH